MRLFLFMEHCNYRQGIYILENIPDIEDVKHAGNTDTAWACSDPGFDNIMAFALNRYQGWKALAI